MDQVGNDFRAVIERISAGSEEAVWELIENYGPHIQRVVRRRLNQSLRSKFDSIDFVQMVWASLFADLNKIANQRDPEELILYLVGMARNKVLEETRRRFKFERYNVSKERSLTQSDLVEPESVKKHDTPSQHLIAKEQLQRMMGSSQRDRRIVQMRLKGATYTQIAKAMGMHERTIRQIVESIEQTAVHS
jgi:RNA polymerase sigma-70 factor (ECF subfamily)